MKKNKTLKMIRKSMRDDRLENPESYNRSQVFEDRRERRKKTRRAQIENAIKEQIEEDELFLDIFYENSDNSVE